MAFAPSDVFWDARPDFLGGVAAEGEGVLAAAAAARPLGQKHLGRGELPARRAPVHLGEGRAMQVK